MSTQLSLLPQQGLYQSPPLVPQYTAPSGSGASRLGKILYPAADPIPYRLCGIYWLILHNQVEVLHGQFSLTTTPAVLQPSVQEVPSLQSWMYYMAVRTSDPQLRGMLAYCHLIIREALRHGGNGWQEYDRTFRRQAAINPTIRSGPQSASRHTTGQPGSIWNLLLNLNGA